MSLQHSTRFQSSQQTVARGHCQSAGPIPQPCRPGRSGQRLRDSGVCVRVASVELEGQRLAQRLVSPLPPSPQHFPSGVDELQEQDLQPETRTVGSLLGALCGNVLGAPVQHERHYQVARIFPQGLTEFWGHDVATRPMRKGHASGEYQQLLATAHALIQARSADARVLAANLAGRCDTTARRYTPHSEYIIRRLQDPRADIESLGFLATLPVQAAQVYAIDRSKAAQSVSDRWEREPWGPADNTAAAAYSVPLALAYRTSAWEVVDQAVQEACLLSHTHPVGIDGARVMAAAVHWLLQQPPAPKAVGSGAAVGPQALLAHLLTVAQTQDMRSKLEWLQQQLFQVDEIQSWSQFYKSRQWHQLTQVLGRITYHDLATVGTEAVAVALWAFCTHWQRPHQAVCVAAVFAGSAPVTTQLVGALAGALHGTAWVPDSWWRQLENVAYTGGEDWSQWQGVSEDGALRSGGLPVEKQQEGPMGLRDESVVVAQKLADLQCTKVGFPAVASSVAMQ